MTDSERNGAPRHPRLTVIMPAYNAMPYLREAVDSILGQTLRDWVMLIVDDGSSDDTHEYLTGLTDQRVIIHRMEQNAGQGFARNYAIALTYTKYTAFMDADDVSLPGRLEAQVAFLEDHPEIGVVGTRVKYMGETGKVGMEPPLPREHSAIDAALMAGQNALVNATICCRTRLLKEAGGFRFAGKGEDWDLFLRMAELTRLANLNQVLFHYRVHGGSTNAQYLKEMRGSIVMACDAARLRRGMGVSPTRDDRSRFQAHPGWIERLDLYGQTCYQRAVRMRLSANPWRGYFYLLVAAALSPKRAALRVAREMRVRAM